VTNSEAEPLEVEGARAKAERLWLDYAWTVVSMRTHAPKHYERCFQLHRKKGTEHHVEAGRLRWPGAVGSAWEPGQGVLFVGSVHSRFFKGRRGEIDHDLEDRLAQANKDWLTSGRSPSHDALYLHETQAVYERGVTLWPRGELAESLMQQLGDGPADLAWVNLARCQSMPREESEYRMQQECERAYPLADVVTALRPAAILIAGITCVERPSKEVGRTLPASGLVLYGRGCAPAVFAFSGFSGKDAKGRESEVWLPDAVAEVHSRRGSGVER
jgi:hypothetical protein